MKKKNVFICLLMALSLVCNLLFLSSKIVTLPPKNQAIRFCQGVRPLLNE